MKRYLIAFSIFAVLLAAVHAAKNKPQLINTFASGRWWGETPSSQASPQQIATAPVRPDHIVIVIMENHSFGQIIGSPEAPHINALAAEGASIVNGPMDPAGLHSGSHAVRHPSQPNYLELFSGNNQGTIQDGHPGTSSEPFTSPPPFATPNLGAALRHAGYTFATYSEDLPSVGSDDDGGGGSSGYQRKHNPAVNWQSADAGPANNHLPPELNQPFFPLPGQPATGFPTDFNQLPTVAIVVPNQQHDMHDGTIAEGDIWIKQNIIDTYYRWAKTHNSLLIVTFDEDGDDTASNQITTIFAGPMIQPGNYTETDLNIGNPYVGAPGDPGIQTPTGTAMNHWNVLSTILDLYGLAHIDRSINRPALTDIFLSPLIVRPLVVPNALTGRQGDLGNLFPLFSSQPIRYQQVYRSLEFSRFAAGGEMITSIAFRAHLPGLPFTGTIPQLQVNLSTTNRSPDNLNTTFAANVGADDAQVFSGPLSIVVTDSGPQDGPTNFDVVINFSTPFHYDPSQGNLLVDIRNLQGGTQTPPLDQQLDATSTTGDAVSRVFNYGDANATSAGQTGGVDELDTIGLVAQFGTNTSPGVTPVHVITVVSRKMHGGAGTFDVDLPMSGQPGIECRSGGANGEHTIVFTFGDTLTQVDGATVTSGTGSVNNSMIDSADSHRYIVHLTGVANTQTITVTLTNVTDSAGDSSSGVSASMSVLAGDSTANGSVNSGDIAQIKSESGQAVTATNFREDLNADGAIDSSDIAFAKSKSGAGLP